MLPPDTSSTLFPWRVMVPTMQVYGCFPFRVSATTESPTFSLPLCLWSIFRVLLQISRYGHGFKEYILQYSSPEVGTIAYTSTWTVAMTVMFLTPAAMGVRSHKLADLLHNLSKITEVPPPPTHRWYCKPQTQLAMLSGVIFTTFSICKDAQMDSESIFETVILSPVTMLFCMTFMLPEYVSSMVFGLLGRRLVAVTEATVATVSKLLTPDGSFKRESDVEAAMLALRDLDAVIREVELQREAGTRCFFPVVTMRLLMAILLAIVCPYAILRGTLLGGAMIISMCFGFFIMFSCCHVGQTFVNQVSAAEGLLKDLTVKSHILSLSLKVNQLMGRLSHNLAFDMCGWYRLDYYSFLGLINTVLTYVVIIFQVGGNRVYSPSSSSSPSNSSVLA